MFSSRNSIFTIVSIWLLASIVSSPFIFMTEYSSVVEQCWLNLSEIKLFYIFLFNIIFIFLPTIALGFLYIYIIINLRKHNRLFSISNGQMGLRIHLRSSIPLRSNKYEKCLNLSVSEIEKLKYAQSLKENKELKSKEIKKPLHLWNKKRSRSCSFCFSGSKNNYECRCTKSQEIFLKNSNSSKSFTMGKPTNSKNLGFGKIKRLKPRYSAYNKINFTVVISLITLIFFCCQLPIRIFILWSNFKQFYSPPMFINNLASNDINLINIISNLTTSIYFFHCISNPIIYNLLSAKFRRAFLTLGISKKNCVCTKIQKI